MDVGALEEIVIAEVEAVFRISIRFSVLRIAVEKVSERLTIKRKRARGDVTGFSRERGAIISLGEVLHVRWDVSKWKVIHTFVETGMCSDFNASGGDVIPKYIAGGVRDVTKEYTFNRCGAKFCFAVVAGRTDPHATAKCM